MKYAIIALLASLVVILCLWIFTDWAYISTPQQEQPTAFTRSVSENITITNGVSATADITPSPSTPGTQETLSISASVSARCDFRRSVSENITISDSVTVTVERAGPYGISWEEK